MSDFTNGPEDDPFDGYDPFDAELGTRMRNLGGPAIDADTALRGMRPALQRARARRRAGVAAGSLGLMLAMGTAVFAMTGDGGPLGRTPISIRPANHDTRRSTTASTGSQTAAADGQVTGPGTGPGRGPGNSSTASGGHGDQGQGNGGPGARTSAGTNTTTQSSGRGAGGTSTTPDNPTSSTTPAITGSTAIGATTSTGNGTTTTTANGQQTQTFSGVGGSVTISWDATSITARSNLANSGYIATITTNIPDRYEVRFRSGSLTTDIKLRVVNGVLQPPVINEH